LNTSAPVPDKPANRRWFTNEQRATVKRHHMGFAVLVVGGGLVGFAIHKRPDEVVKIMKTVPATIEALAKLGLFD